VLWWAAGVDAFWLSSGLWAKVSRLGLVIAAGGTAYFGALWLVGFRIADFNRREV
jgi:putative peptidoglycan lipid II flippase